MEDKNKLTNAQYKFVCELLWGGVPVDKDWAIGCNLFKAEAPKILTLYPHLDKSFFEYRGLDTTTSKQMGLNKALSEMDPQARDETFRSIDKLADQEIVKKDLSGTTAEIDPESSPSLI